MTRLFRTPRFLMLAASTAVVVGGALTPTGAFAATPAAPHAAVADDRVVAPDDQGGTDDRGNLLLIGRAGESLFGSDRGDADPGTGIRIDPPRSHTWFCIKAPCDDPLAKPVPDDVPVPDGIQVPDVTVPDVTVPDVPVPVEVVTPGDLTSPNG
ncbi:hypothetical protein [Streptomyces sp. NBC_01233]|uniref:hypothetical protein n=1 Tax=Streptomyces sp. NBC_01233 TaxID=2903787 RepID=UPI002E140C77|nr:hypothetical protein OG332_45240 [Streptomyces sp. NBC_01233]